MAIRTKTRNRMLILAAATLLLCGVGATVYTIGANKAAARVGQARVDGMSAYQGGDFGRAVRLLGHYLDKAHAQQTDPEALFAYGRSRLIYDPNPRHRLEAMRVFESYLRLKPGDIEAQHLLLNLYARVNYPEEATKLAGDVLALAPQDAVALSVKAQMLRGQRKYAEALKASEELNRVAPQDMLGQLLTLQLLIDQKEKSSKLLAKYEALYSANKGNPRFEVLYALALQATQKIEKAREILKEAAAHAASDLAVVPDLSRILSERFGMYDESLALLEAAVAQAGADAGKPTRSIGADLFGDQPSLLQMLMERKWQLGRYEEVAQRLSGLNAVSSDTDVSLLVLRALSLYELDRKAEATAIVDAMQKQSDDSAVAWAGAIKARYAQPPVSPAAMVKQYKAVLEHAPNNAIVHFMVGEAYFAQGELDLALASWRQAAGQAPGWSAPVAMAARAMVANGRNEQAIPLAREAARRGQSAGAVVTYIRALYGMVGDNGGEKECQGLLSTVQSFRKQVPDEMETAHVEAAMLARLGRQEEARALVEKLAKAEPTPPLPVLLDLTRTSVNHKLDQEDALLARANHAYGSRPEIAVLQAVLLHRDGKTEEGLKLLQAGRDKAGSPDAVAGWRLAIVHFMDDTRDPNALAEWTRLGDAYPDSLLVQSAVLRSPTRVTDRPFWKRSIDRIKKLTGEEAYTPRIEQARWLLEGKTSDKEASEAIDLLSRVTNSAPTMPEPRRLLANAYEKVAAAKDADDKIEFQRRAVEELRVAFNLRPTDAQIAQDLARLLKAIGKPEEATTVLDRLARATADTPEARIRLARALIGEGRLAQAIDTLLPIEDGTMAIRDAMLAELYRRTGKSQEAAKYFDALLDASGPDPEALLAAANFFADRNETEHAQKFLARLAELSLAPGQWELMMARFAERHLGPDDAVKQYVAATKAQHAGAETWRALANYQLRLGRLADASASSAEGLKLFVDDPELTALAACARAFEAYQGDANLASLAAVLAADARGPASAELIKLIVDAKANHESPLQTTDKLRELAQRRPSFPLLGHVFGTYMQLGESSKAQQVAQQAANANPNDPTPLRWLTTAYTSSGQWDKALTASREWRQRVADDPREADIAIAQIMLHTKPALPEAAMRQLEPHLAGATQGEGDIAILSTYARALIANGQAKRAAELLRPLAQSKPAFRAVWLQLASVAFNESAAAAAWMDQVEPLIAKDSAKEQAALADAWYRVGMKFQWLPGFEKAGKVLEPMLADPAAKAEAWRQWAVVSEALGDLTEAERGYRKLLALQPDLPEAQNNLAYILLTRAQGNDVALAKELIDKAIAAEPTSATFYDTRARIETVSGNRASAIQSYRKAIALNPNSVEALIGLADLLAQDKQTDEVRALLARINAMVTSPSRLPLVLQKQLESVRNSQKPPAAGSRPTGGAKAEDAVGTLSGN